MTASDDEDVAELIEINLMFAQMELSLGADDAAAVQRALDHVKEALKHLRSETRGAFEDAERSKSGEQPGEFA